jgi:hypothetical protein
MLLLAGMALAAAPAQAERRAALVVGNDAYTHVIPLERAGADAWSYQETQQVPFCCRISRDKLK